MTDQHATSVIPARLPCLEEDCTAEHWGYRALCACRWKGRRYPSDKRRLAEDDAARHASYVADVARLIGRGQGR